MAVFQYQAKRGPRDLIDGVIEADSQAQALGRLTAQGLFPLRVNERRVLSTGPAFWRSVRSQHMALFTRQLADLLESNVPLLRALALAEAQAAHPALQDILRVIGDRVRGGKSLSESLSEFPDCFPPAYVHLVYAGETGGMLALTMDRLAGFMEQEEEFRARLRAALAYPLFIAGIGGLTVIFLLLFVVPRLTGMFADTGQSLPWMAQALAWTSQVLSSVQGSLVLCVGVGGMGGLLYRAPHKLRVFLIQALFRVPVWGAVMTKSMLARFAKTLAMLLSGGVPVVRALEVSAHALSHPAYRGRLARVIESVRQGASVSGGLEETALFPAFVCQMIAIGEEANTLEKALEKIALAYDRQTDRAMKLATSLLEPLMIFAVGAVIGAIVIGMLLPIFEMSASVK